ncbi:MAG: hypothetical protein E7162_05710 [Firmicutes bacterium]|nr:hypothetical protein [Bacillota bacterium]
MKKILNFLLCLILITGCSNEKKNEKQTEENKDKESEVVETAYRCDNKEDDDIVYYFYYTDDKLTKAELTTIYLDEYSYIKEEAEEEYTGVTVSKRNNEVLIEIDVLNGGMEYLKGETVLYYDESNDTFWDNIEKVMNEYNFVCKVK